MVILGHVENGVIVPDAPVPLPEGVAVRIEYSDTAMNTLPRRVGGYWKGQVVIAEDFDVMPNDLSNAFGVSAE